jgi:hypothetical protein
MQRHLLYWSAKMKKLVLIVTAFLGISTGSAFATCTSPAVMHDFASTAFNMSLATNAGDGNCASNVGIIGTLPPFANPPSIANTSFGISGTLPGYTSTPTFNLGTLNGAATAAKQPALGTAGTPSADVISVQGVSGGTPQPISAASGAIGANAYAAGAVVAGAFVDGWNITEGTKADSAYAGSGSASVVALLKGIYAVASNGTVANGATASTSSVQVAGIGQSAEQAALTAGQQSGFAMDLASKQVTSPYANRGSFLNCAVTITGTSATTCTGMAAQGAGVKIYITNLCITRNDAGTTAATATLNDTATSPYDIPNNGGGGGICPPLLVPLQVAANTAFQITMGTSITSVHVTASGYKGY